MTREQNFKLQDMNRNLEGKVRDRTKQLADKHQQLRTAYVQTIRALAEAVDAKDAYTRGHSERVGVYASKIAREMNFAKDFIERVYIAGLLHDVGKIGVRDAVITKPDRLTPAEYEEIKKHPEIGAKILEPVEFLQATSRPACDTTTSGTTAPTAATRIGCAATRSPCRRGSSWWPTPSRR